MDGPDGGALAPEALSIPAIPGAARNFSGSFANRSAHRVEQKRWVFPACSTFPAARCGSIIIPQTGSFTRAAEPKIGSDVPTGLAVAPEICTGTPAIFLDPGSSGRAKYFSGMAWNFCAQAAQQK
jgi:hypothetical protein